jgi:hypothetical protein
VDQEAAGRGAGVVRDPDEDDTEWTSRWPWHDATPTRHYLIFCASLLAFSVAMLVIGLALTVFGWYALLAIVLAPAVAMIWIWHRSRKGAVAAAAGPAA